MTVAENGAAALKAIENDPIDGIVTDFRMPDMNGDELISRIRERQPDIPAIIASSSPSEIPPQGGRTDVFSKPVLPRQLVYRMIEMLIAVEDARHIKSSEYPG